MKVSVSTDPKDDPLVSSPPQPDIPSANSRAKKRSLPYSEDEAQAETAAKAAHILGLAPQMELMQDMMAAQKLIQKIGLKIPAVIQIFEPALQQARDVVEAALGNMAQGGLPYAQMGPETIPGAGGPAGPTPGAAPDAVSGPPPMPPPIS